MRADAHGEHAHEHVQREGGEGAIRVSSGREQGGLVTRCSVARGRAMSPGIQKSPFYWRDVVHGPPPRRRERGDCIHVTFHGADDSGDVRLRFTSIVRVDPGIDKGSVHDDVVHVEERVYVQRRVLQELVDRERAFTDRVSLRMRSRLAHKLATKRRRANQIESATSLAIYMWHVRLQAKAGNAAIQGFRSFMRALVALPDALLTHTERVSIHLASRTGRRTIRKAVHDPASATAAEKAALLVVLAFATLTGVLVLNTIFDFTPAGVRAAYYRLLGDFALSLAGTLAVPFPSEIGYIGSAVALNIVLGAVGIFAGKMLASWMLYLVGDSLFDSMNKKSGPRMKRAIHWLQRNANRWGFAILIAINATPLAPDAFIIVFAVSGMRFRSYMVGIAVGAILKFALLAGLILWIGPTQVQDFMAQPIQTMRGG